MRINPIRFQTVLFSSIQLSACGQLSDSSTSSGDGSGTGTSSGDPFSTQTSVGSSKSGTYGFNYTETLYGCTDGSRGVGEGASMEMTVEVGDGRIAFGQSASSAATSQATIANSGIEVISSTAISGTIQSTGAFSATSTAFFRDYKMGYINAKYRFNGLISGNSWTGKYEFDLYFSDYGVACSYSSNFYGARR